MAVIERQLDRLIQKQEKLFGKLHSEVVNLKYDSGKNKVEALNRLDRMAEDFAGAIMIEKSKITINLFYPQTTGKEVKALKRLSDKLTKSFDTTYEKIFKLKYGTENNPLEVLDNLMTDFTKKTDRTKNLVYHYHNL